MTDAHQTLGPQDHVLLENHTDARDRHWLIRQSLCFWTACLQWPSPLLEHYPVKNIWGHLKKSLVSSRRTIKASGAAQQDEACMAFAKKVWQLRWSLLKKPGNLSVEDKQALAELENEDEGFVYSFLVD